MCTLLALPQVSQIVGADNPFPSAPRGILHVMNLSYIVLYASDPETSAAWYESALGLRFTVEQHGANGPVHYSTALDGGTVLELYPAASDRPRSRVRLGITVRDPFGVRPEPTIVTDPDGNRIEVRAASA